MHLRMSNQQGAEPVPRIDCYRNLTSSQTHKYLYCKNAQPDQVMSELMPKLLPASSVPKVFERKWKLEAELASPDLLKEALMHGWNSELVMETGSASVQLPDGPVECIEIEIQFPGRVAVSVITRLDQLRRRKLSDQKKHQRRR